MSYYETSDNLTKAQATKFIKEVDEKIGVDCELNQVDETQYYVMVMDLEDKDEVAICAAIENSL